jgi:hypothetical protein
MDKLKKIILLSSVIVLAIVSISTFTQSTRAEKRIKDNLVIVPLYNNLMTGVKGEDGSLWSVGAIDLDKTTATFAVLPVGLPPYSWEIDNSSLGTLIPSVDGFKVDLKPMRPGETVLRVKNSFGLKGSTDIVISRTATTEPTVSVPSAE